MTCRSFPDGEVKVQIQEDVRGSDVFVVQSTHSNDFLMELLAIADALRRASANRITAVIPYFGYARQDRKHDGRVPITAKLVANMIADRRHRPRGDRRSARDPDPGLLRHPGRSPAGAAGAARLPVDLIWTTPVVLSPDTGSIKVADKLAQASLGVSLAIIDKRRTGDSPDRGRQRHR